MAVVTPSFAPDFELCADLNRSVMEFAESTVDHHIIVPGRDLALFDRLRGPRTHIHRVADFLPRRFVAVPGNLWINVRRPFPPARGWITQQIVKLAVTASLECDVVLLVDSDMRFVRPLTTEMFWRDGVVRFYRKPDEIDARLPRHLLWHDVSRRLLALPTAPPPPLTDYICWPAPWAPDLVRRLLGRVSDVGSRPWQDIVAAQVHFSEEILYGVFVDEMLGAPANDFATDRMSCHSYSAEVPLDADALRAFLGQVAPDDVAVMISAKSGTPLELRRRVLRDWTDGA